MHDSILVFETPPEFLQAQVRLQEEERTDWHPRSEYNKLGIINGATAYTANKKARLSRCGR